MPILNPALEGFYESDNRYYVLYGGRASSKTYHTAGFLAFLASEYTIKVLCTRQFQNKIGDSVKAVIELAIEDAGMRDEFKITDNSIMHTGTGSEFIFYGIQRNLKEIKGLANIDILWVEECESLTKEQWKVIMPTIREEGSRIFLVFNPNLITDFVWQRFVVNPPPNTIVRKINHDENPYLSKTMKDVITAAFLEDEDEANHIYNGVPRADDDDAVIKLSWIESAIDADVKLMISPTGVRKGALDVADQGADECAFAGRHGILLDYLESWKGKGSDIMETVERAFLICDTLRFGQFDYDGDGLGAGVRGDARVINERREIQDEKQIAVTAFQGSSSVHRPKAKDKASGRLNVDMFANRKAQGWWDLRQRFQATHRAVINKVAPDDRDSLISIPSNLPGLEKLKSELTQPKYSHNGAGKILIDKAPDGTKSPNLADAVMIVYASSVIPISEKEKRAGRINGYAPSDSSMGHLG